MTQSPPSPSGRPQPVSNTKMLVIAFALAIAAVIMVILYTQMLRAQATEGTVTVFTLARSVSAGDRLDIDRDINEQRIPERLQDAVQVGLNPIIGGSELQSMVEQPVQQSAARGSLITHRLFRAGDERGRQTPEEGKVFIDIPLTPRHTVGNLRPESFINIHAPFPSGGGGPPRILPVLERVRVVYVGALGIDDVDGTRGTRAFQNITIEIDEVDEIAMENIKRISRDYGDFSVTVRSGGGSRRWQSRPGQPQVNPEVVELFRERFNIDLYPDQS